MATGTSKQLLSEVARARRDTQLNEIDGLDSKAAQLLAFAAILLGLLFSTDLATESWNWVSTAGAVSFIAAAIALGVAIWPRGYRFDPNVAVLNKLAMNWQPDDSHKIIALSAERAIAHNQDLLKQKSGAVRIGVVLLVVGVLATGGRLIYVAANDEELRAKDGKAAADHHDGRSQGGGERRRGGRGRDDPGHRGRQAD